MVVLGAFRVVSEADCSLRVVSDADYSLRFVPYSNCSYIPSPSLFLVLSGLADLSILPLTKYFSLDVCGYFNPKRDEFICLKFW